MNLLTQPSPEFRRFVRSAALGWMVAVASALGWQAEATRAQPPQPSPPEPGYLGLIVDDRAEMGRGLRVVEVIQAAPAEAAGLKTGDLITSINDKPIHSMQDMVQILEPLPAGTELKFAVSRGEEFIELKATLGRRPPPGQRRFDQFGPLPESPQSVQPPATPQRRRLLGVRTTNVSDEARIALRLPVSTGALVTAVEADSPAARAGIPIDAVIVSVNGEQIRDPYQLADVLTRIGPGKDVEIAFYLQGRIDRRMVKLDLLPSGPAPTIPGSPDMQPAVPPFEAAPTTVSPSLIERLERRIQELEQRIEELERRLTAMDPQST